MSWVLYSSVKLGKELRLSFFTKILILLMQTIKLSLINVILECS